MSDRMIFQSEKFSAISPLIRRFSCPSRHKGCFFFHTFKISTNIIKYDHSTTCNRSTITVFMAWFKTGNNFTTFFIIRFVHTFLKQSMADISFYFITRKLKDIQYTILVPPDNKEWKKKWSWTIGCIHCCWPKQNQRICVYMHALFSTLPFTCKSMYILIKGLMMIFICNNLAVFHHSRPNLPQTLNFFFKTYENYTRQFSAVNN